MPSSSRIFTGRADYLEKLRQYFSVLTGEPRERKQFLLYGMGGAGKSQICMKFAEESAEL
jgi:hypothetical protein